MRLVGEPVAFDCGFSPCYQVYLRGRALAHTYLLSFNAADGSTGDFGAFSVTVSANGQVSAFSSRSDDLSPIDANGFSDVFAAATPLPLVEIPVLSRIGIAILAAGLLLAGWGLIRRLGA